MEFVVDIIDYTQVATKDQNIKPDDSDTLHFELCDMLIENNLFQMASIALEKVIDQHSSKYLLTKAKIRTM